MKMEILTVGDERLRRKARRVSVVDDHAFEVIRKMREMSLEWEKEHPHEMSAAMAAPQIGEDARIVIIRDSMEDKGETSFVALINPEVIRTEGKMVEDYEGCLSVPEVYGLVKRPSKVKIRALNEEGQEVRIKAEEGLARTILHEIDHLDGVLFIDHIRGEEDKFYRLNSKGDLEPLDYSEVEGMGLWEGED